MRKLFIIGNGFDLSHKLKTKYDDFRKYLKTECNGIYHYVPETSIDSKGRKFVSDNFAAGFILALLDGYYGVDWGDIEAALPNLNYNRYLTNIDEGGANWLQQLHKRSDQFNNLTYCVIKIIELLSKWIETISTNNIRPRKKYQEKMSDEDIFLTFNYTATLENVYKINSNNIWHIHGKIGEHIVFGHGKSSNLDEETYSAVNNDLQDLIDSFKKDITCCMNKHREFFANLSKGEVQHIYSIGFSFSQADLAYIIKICQIIDTSNIVWHLSKHDKKKEKIHNYEKIIRKCGFKGKFGGLI